MTPQSRTACFWIALSIPVLFLADGCGSGTNGGGNTPSNPTLTVTTSSVPNGVVGSAYSATLAATGGSSTGYTWSVTSGTGLSAVGLTLSSAGGITGTPSAAENAVAFNVQVTDSLGDKATAQLSLTVTLGPSGHVNGGLQAITGANVQLWEAGATGYGSVPTLLASATTDSYGNFAIPISSWTANCTASGSNSTIPVYITSSGGNTGAGVNPAIVLMTALGQCNTVSSTTSMIVNEVTTVAAAYALGPFINPAHSNQVGADATNQVGIMSAFNTAADLVNISTGTANSLTPVGIGGVPQAELNTLANILAYCVGGSAGNCNTLENDAFNSSGSTLGTGFTTPANTLMAAQQIASYPGNNVAALYLLATDSPVFEPALSSAPNDWSVAIQYATNPADTATTSNLSVALAIDQNNNVWIANNTQSNVEKISNRGVPYSYSPMTNTCTNCTPINAPSGLAIDFQGNAWVLNNGSVFDLCANSGTQCSSTYGPGAGSGYENVNMQAPSAFAFDGNGNLWITSKNPAPLNNDFPLTELVNVGNSTSGSTAFANYTPGQKLVGIAVDAGGNLWVIDQKTNSLYEISPSGAVLTTLAAFSPQAVSLDQAGNIWVVTESGTPLIEYSSSGTLLSGGSGYKYTSGVFPFDPQAIAMDGANRIWVTDKNATPQPSSVGEFSDSGTYIGPSTDTGYEMSGMSSAVSGLAIDRSGNIWVGSVFPSQIPGTTSYGAITKFVGLATPVQTPLVSGLNNGQIAPKP
jgi:sugar lactone lactonase YvrE